MLEWLFKPIFKTQLCTGDEVMVCHNDVLGLTPIVFIMISIFSLILLTASFINKKRYEKMEKENGEI